MKNWSTYLLKCSDHSLYCGVTKDFKARLKEHNGGAASKYTRSRLPVELVGIRQDLTKSQAHKLEYRVKKSPKHKKVQVLKDWPIR